MGRAVQRGFSHRFFFSPPRGELRDRFTNSRRCIAFFRPGFHARTRFHSGRCGALALLRAFVPGLSCERTVRSLEEFYKIPSSTNFHFVSIKRERERERKGYPRGTFFENEIIIKYSIGIGLLLGHPVRIWRRAGRRRESQVRVRNWSIIGFIEIGNRATISRAEAWKSVEIGIGIGRTAGHRFPSPEKHRWKSRYYSDTRAMCTH